MLHSNGASMTFVFEEKGLQSVIRQNGNLSAEAAHIGVLLIEDRLKKKVKASGNPAWSNAYADELLDLARLSFSYFGTFTHVRLDKPYLIRIDYERDDMLGSFNLAVPEGMGFLGGVITIYQKTLVKDNMIPESPKRFVSESLITLAHEYTHATLAEIGAHKGMRDGFSEILDESVANFVSHLFAKKIGIINFNKYEKMPSKLASAQQTQEIFAEIYAEEWIRQNGSDMDSAAVLFAEEVIERVEQLCYAIYESSGDVGTFLKVISTIETVDDFRNELARATRAKTASFRQETRK